MVTAARLLIEHGIPEHGRVLITLHGCTRAAATSRCTS